jgi:hypothetical protein
MAKLTELQKVQRRGARQLANVAIRKLHYALDCGVAARETFRHETRAQRNAQFASYRDEARNNAIASAHFAFMAHPELREEIA